MAFKGQPAFEAAATLIAWEENKAAQGLEDKAPLSGLPARAGRRRTRGPREPLSASCSPPLVASAAQKHGQTSLHRTPVVSQQPPH